jgi:hypothetical protein
MEIDENLQQYTGTISPSQLSRKNSARDPQILQIIFDFNKLLFVNASDTT